MPVVMRIEGLVHGPSPFDGQYLKEYDPNRDGTAPDGTPMLAHIVTTRVLSEAMRFPSVLEMMELWRTQSRRQPLRPDGKANRPLTAFTITSVPLP